jgi:hypothetical protein
MRLQCAGAVQISDDEQLMEILLELFDCPCWPDSFAISPYHIEPAACDICRVAVAATKDYSGPFSVLIHLHNSAQFAHLPYYLQLDTPSDHATAED